MEEWNDEIRALKIFAEWDEVELIMEEIWDEITPFDV